MASAAHNEHAEAEDGASRADPLREKGVRVSWNRGEQRHNGWIHWSIARPRAFEGLQQLLKGVDQLEAAGTETAVGLKSVVHPTEVISSLNHRVGGVKTLRPQFIKLRPFCVILAIGPIIIDIHADDKEAAIVAVAVEDTAIDDRLRKLETEEEGVIDSLLFQPGIAEIG